MLIDTHCHLDASEFDVDRDELVRDALTCGVSAMIIPSVSAANFDAVRQCCTRYAMCYPAYGLHPLYLAGGFEQDCVRLHRWLTKELGSAKPPVAIGEIGLDFHIPGADALQQEQAFIEQLKIAWQFDLPVLLHVRHAIDQVLKYLRRINVRGGVAHAFNGSRQQADEFLRLGFKLGFGGAMTYPGSARIRRLVVSLPIEAIVLETDAPDIPPVWRTNERHVPSDLGRIAEVLAQLRGLTRTEVEKYTAQNIQSLIPLPVDAGICVQGPLPIGKRTK